MSVIKILIIIIGSGGSNRNLVLPFFFGNTVTLSGPEARMETFKLTPLKKSTDKKYIFYTNYDIREENKTLKSTTSKH